MQLHQSRNTPNPQNPQYRSFSVPASQQFESISDFHLKSSTLFNSVPSSKQSQCNDSCSYNSYNSTSSGVIATDTHQPCATYIADTASQAPMAANYSKIHVNDYPLPFEFQPFTMHSVQIKPSVKVEDAITSISISLGGTVDIMRGRIRASLPNVTITVTLYRDMSNGKCYLEFDRNDGCPFRFAYYFYKSVLEAGSLLEVDSNEAKFKFQGAEFKLKSWEEAGAISNPGTFEAQQNAFEKKCAQA